MALKKSVLKMIPLVDISGFRSGSEAEKAHVAGTVRDACETVGFFYLAGHGIGGEIIRAMRDILVEFFARPECEKLCVAITPDLYRGYIPIAAFSANDGTVKQPDLYEGYKLHAERSGGTGDGGVVPANVCPEKPADFRDTVLTYWREMDRVSDQLLRIFALTLGQCECSLVDCFKSPMTNMTLLHYPSMKRGLDGFGIHPHKDSDAFTILYPDPVGGLEVRPVCGRDWIRADCPPGAFVVNIGDMMELWSGGRFRSTPHKVVNCTGAERYSFPYFAIPNENTEIEPMVRPVEGFSRTSLDVGAFMSEVYRTNRIDQKPKDDTLDLGTLSD